jgi:hypothetical protein
MPEIRLEISRKNRAWLFLFAKRGWYIHGPLVVDAGQTAVPAK